VTDLPDPLVPPDVDLRGMPYMPLDVVRLFDSDFYALSNGAEFKAGLSLWCKAFLQVPAGSLPNDDRLLAHLSGAGAAWAKVRDMALHGWIKCSDGRLYHRTVAEKVNSAWDGRKAMLGRFAHIKERRSELTVGQWESIRSVVFARDDYTCSYCGSRGKRLECDHIVPVAKGGSHGFDNLTTACKPCNRRKGSKTVQEWMQ
jgi:hypothetical protein